MKWNFEGFSHNDHQNQFHSVQPWEPIEKIQIPSQFFPEILTKTAMFIVKIDFSIFYEFSGGILLKNHDDRFKKKIIKNSSEFSSGIASVQIYKITKFSIKNLQVTSS